MRPETKKSLLSLMDEVAAKLSDTRVMVFGSCGGLEAQRYGMRLDEVLDEVARAKALVSATDEGTDTDT